MKQWLSKVLAMAVFCLLAAVPGLAATLVDVKAGRLEFVETGDMEYELRLNKKYVEKYAYCYVGIDRVFKNVGGKDIVLISTTTGGSGSGYYYELVTVTEKGKVTVTEHFGTGYPPTISQQGQKITFLFPGGRMWAFDNGTLREDKTSKNASLSDKDCKGLYDTYLEACVKKKMCSGTKRNFPMAYERDIMYYEGKINEANFDSLCSQACRGKTTPYPLFKARICKR